MKKVIVIAVAIFCAASFAFAAEKGTAKEARQMVEKGIAFIKANGKEKAFAEFNNPKGKFLNKDLYLFALDFNGITLAQGGNPKLVGKNMINVRDADQKYFIKDMITLAKSKGERLAELQVDQSRHKESRSQVHLYSKIRRLFYRLRDL